jgi:hypothetical protein
MKITIEIKPEVYKGAVQYYKEVCGITDAREIKEAIKGDCEMWADDQLGSEYNPNHYPINS